MRSCCPQYTCLCPQRYHSVSFTFWELTTLWLMPCHNNYLKQWSPSYQGSRSTAFNPLVMCRAIGVMFHTSAKSRQPHRSAWSCEQLYHECVVALGYALDSSTILTYNSHLQSYLSFCKLHSFALNPTPDTLSFFIIFMAHDIKPISITQYLSGIVNSLESYFPDIRKN